MDVATGTLTGETARLSAVDATRVVSDAVGPALSGLARLAADTLSAPIAAVTLVDSDRVRVVAKHQLVLSQFPLSASPCVHVVSERTPLYVPDLRADPRFQAGSLTAVGIGARSYAGVPLIDPEGYAVGTLCVLGHEAGTLGPERRELLTMLGAQANALLSLGRSAAQNDPMGRLGTEFLAMMTHEVRTPITVITGYLELLDESEAIPQQYRQKMAAAVRRNTERLVRLVDHLLLAASGHEGLAASLTLTRTDLTGIVAEVVAAARGRAELGGTALDLLPSATIVVPLDRGLIRTAVDNLVTNALGFTPPGGRITVEVTGGQGNSAREGARGPMAWVTVADTGIGIPLSEQALVFERFYRGEHARATEAPGTGLGLSITAAIAAAHGGRVWLESSLGEGTVAHLGLPVRIEAAS